LPLIDDNACLKKRVTDAIKPSCGSLDMRISWYKGNKVLRKIAPKNAPVGRENCSKILPS
jgi:hypothetical protein